MWWLQAWHSFIPFHASWLPASHGGYGDIVSEKRLLGLEGAFPVARPQRNKTWPLSILVLCISVSKRIFTGPWYSKRSFHSAFMVQWSSTCWDKSQGCEWWVPSRVVRGLFPEVASIRGIVTCRISELERTVYPSFKPAKLERTYTFSVEQYHLERQ